MKPAKDIIQHRGLYEKDVSTIKRIGPYIRVCNLKACRVSGLEDESRCVSRKGTVNDCKLENNLARARTAIREYALCNTWAWFCTFTIDGSKHDRFDFATYYKKFSKFIKNYNRYCSEEEKVRYLFIPEKHKDGAWHIHGLLSGIKDKDRTINRNGYLTWKQYDEKFGFMSFSPIKDIEAISKYITKYITKAIGSTMMELGVALYYVSKGLKRGERLFRGQVRLNCSWDYETPDGFCRIKEFDEMTDDIGAMLEIMT